MTPKEILYVDDALSHAQFLTQQCREAAGTLQDKTLQEKARQLESTHSSLYSQFYKLL